MCTVNKSVHAKKSGNLMNAPRMSTPNVLAPTVQEAAAIVEWFFACCTVSGCSELESSARQLLVHT